jgi:hypothetical protein
MDSIAITWYWSGNNKVVTKYHDDNSNYTIRTSTCEKVHDENATIGIMLVLLYCICSSLADVYCEYIFKEGLADSIHLQVLL